jgi:RNA polymerase sigma-70 factor (ECF subfamily)
MCFQVSRFNARTDSEHNIILLEYQDRAKWNQDLIRQGFRFLSESSITNYLSEYHVEASIASVHSMATDFASTDWKELLKLYGILEEIKPGVFVSFNKAIALGYAHSPQAGIDALQQINELGDNQYYHTALGNFYLMTKDLAKAKNAFERAKVLTQSIPEIDLLNQKIKTCS